MARTTIPAELVAVNAIQGTLIADNEKSVAARAAYSACAKAVAPTRLMPFLAMFTSVKRLFRFFSTVEKASHPDRCMRVSRGKAEGGSPAEGRIAREGSPRKGRNGYPGKGR